MIHLIQLLDLCGASLGILLTALRLRIQSSLHLLPSTTGLFRKISGLSLAAEEEEKNRYPSFDASFETKAQRSSDRSRDQLLRRFLTGESRRESRGGQLSGDVLTACFCSGLTDQAVTGARTIVLPSRAPLVSLHE